MCRRRRSRCDLILIDPPYGSGLARRALDAGRRPGLARRRRLGQRRAVGETIAVPQGLAIDTDRRFGKAILVLLRRPA